MAKIRIAAPYGFNLTHYFLLDIKFAPFAAIDHHLFQLKIQP
jgi:hypothetical protein